MACSFFIPTLYAFGIATVCSYAPTILCRHREIVKNEQCSRKQLLVQLSFPYTILLSYALVAVSADAVAHAHHCLVPFYNFFPQILIPLIVLSFIAQICLSFRVYRHLNRHFTTVTRRLFSDRDKLQKRLSEEKSILRTVLIQGISPPILGTPYVIIAAFYLPYNHWEDIFKPRFHLTDTYGLSLIDLPAALLVLNPLVDAISVLYVMKTYSEPRKELAKKLKNCLSFKKNAGLPSVDAGNQV